jgi:2-oxoisovalerate dehydrogenase E1 component
MLLSFAASSDDPISGGRHKVLGSKSLLVPPQTSTIASHVPKAMGLAHAIGVAGKQGKRDTVVPNDAVVLCNFGDASANHSTTLGAINAAVWAAYVGSPMPIVFVCEDNGIGISTPTPGGWIRVAFGNRRGLEYRYADGLSLTDTYRAAVQARAFAHRHAKPVFLHVRAVRLMGHAGADVETQYRDKDTIERIEQQDPLLHTAAQLLREGVMSAAEICALYRALEARVARVAEIAITRPKLRTVAEVMASVLPPRRDWPTAISPTPEQRQALFSQEQRQLRTPQNMARQINLALADLMLANENIVVFGEDVGRKGGVYSVTSGLQQKFGSVRVIDTLLDEQSILGLAIGLAHNNYLPVPEIQFLAYVHNAEDQIRGEAATLAFFSSGQFANPMVIRIAGLAYQKGFGGHFHNDNSIAVFRDIPGVVIACPSNGRDAVQMLRTAVELAEREQRLVVFLEPIALYMSKDLHAEGDELWASIYEPPGTGDRIGLSEFCQYGAGTELGIVTYGNGYYLSRKAAKLLEEQHGVGLRILDLRWLAPLDEAALCRALEPCDAVLVVDECRRTGSISEALVTLLLEGLPAPPRIARLTAEDCFIPLADAANLVLPDVEGVMRAALSLVRSGARQAGIG